MTFIESFIENSLFQNPDIMRVVIFLIIFIVTFIGISRVPNFGKNRGIVLIISILLSLLFIYRMTEEQINNIIGATYSYLGIIVLIALPFFILLAITYFSGMPQAMRRISWIVFGGFIIYFWAASEYLTNEETSILLISLILIGIIIVADKGVNKIIRKFWKSNNN